MAAAAVSTNFYMVHKHPEQVEQHNGITQTATDSLAQQSFSDHQYFTQVMKQEFNRKSESMKDNFPGCEISLEDACVRDNSKDMPRDGSYAMLGYRRATADADPLGELQQRMSIEHEKSDRTNHPDGSITHKFKDGSIIYLGVDGSSTYIDPEGNFVCKSLDGQTTRGKITEDTLRNPNFVGKVNVSTIEPRKINN